MTPPFLCETCHVSPSPHRGSEASHFLAWHGRLGALSAAFGDLPCHGTTASGPKPRSVPDASPMLPSVARA